MVNMRASQVKQLILTPPKNSIVFNSELTYAALASYPLSKGHTLVVWKKPVSDLSKLNAEEYAYLMLVVDKVRNILMRVFKVDKVYLMYMDEIKHVHWHLIPRYHKKGIASLNVEPEKIKTYPFVDKLKRALQEKI